MSDDGGLQSRDSNPPANEPTCSPNPFNLALLILSLIILCLMWWILEIPTLFVKQPVSGHDSTQTGWVARIKEFGRILAWNCNRLLMPSSVALITMARSPNAKQWPMLYYFGYESGLEDQAYRRFRAWQWSKIVLVDVLHFVMLIILVARGAIAAKGTSTPMLFAVWLFASTPPSIVGLYLLAVGALSKPPRRFVVGLVGFIILAFLGIGLILGIYFGSLINKIAGAAYAGALTISWAFTIFPLTLVPCCDGRFNRLFLVLGAAVRVAPMLTDLLGLRLYFPNCSINVSAIGITYGVFGIFVLGFALVGGANCEIYRPQLEEMVNPTIERREEYVFLEGGEAGEDQGTARTGE